MQSIRLFSLLWYNFVFLVDHPGSTKPDEQLKTVKRIRKDNNMTSLETLVENNSKQISEVWALFREISKRQEKTDEQIDKMSKDVSRVTHELESVKAKWGRFVEFILAPGIPKAFHSIGIPITRISQRVEAHSKENGDMEIDILGVNHEYVLIVETKSTLSIDDVKDVLKNLARFKLFFPEYQDKKIIGAVAGIEITGKADRYAYQKGLYVLGESDDNVIIKNDSKFKPVVW